MSQDRRRRDNSVNVSSHNSSLEIGYSEETEEDRHLLKSDRSRGSPSSDARSRSHRNTGKQRIDNHSSVIQKWSRMAFPLIVGFVVASIFFVWYDRFSGNSSENPSSSSQENAPNYLRVANGPEFVEEEGEHSAATVEKLNKVQVALENEVQLLSEERKKFETLRESISSKIERGIQGIENEIEDELDVLDELKDNIQDLKQHEREIIDELDSSTGKGTSEEEGTSISSNTNFVDIVSVPRILKEKWTNALEVIDGDRASIEAKYGENANTILNSVDFFDNQDNVIDRMVRKLFYQGNNLHSLGKFWDDSNSYPANQNYNEMQKDETNHFTISVSGTSVTAGHDNYFNQAYPAIWEQRMLKSFEASGLNLTIRNHAMGNNPANPAAICLDALLGYDTDVAVWEFAMMTAGPSRIPATELWIRNALGLPRQPALLFLDGGSGARNIEDKRYNNEIVDGKLVPRKGKANKFIEKGFQSYSGHGHALNHYKDFGVHGHGEYEAIWTLDTLPEYSWKHLQGDDKPNPGGSWHPSPHGHELRGDILAYTYLGLLKQSIERALEFLDVNFFQTPNKPENNNRLPFDIYNSNHAPKYQPLPDILECDPVYCSRPFTCWTMYQPRSMHHMAKLVDSPEIDESESTVSTTIDLSDTNMKITLYEQDVTAVQKGIELGMGYLDRKYHLPISKATGPITLSFDATPKEHSDSQEGILFLCNPPAVWNKRPEGVAEFDNEFVNVFIDDKKATLQQIKSDSKGSFAPCLQATTKLSRGKHTVKIEVTDDNIYSPLSMLIYN